MQHHWQHSYLCACSCSKLPIAPMGKLLTRLPRITLAQLRTLRSTTVCTCRRDLEKFPWPDGNIADVLALTHACTTSNASVNYSMYVPQRPSKVPIAPMGDSHFARCLQGGGVFVDGGGSVTFDSCNITGNTATYVRAHAQNFPSPRWENC